MIAVTSVPFVPPLTNGLHTYILVTDAARLIGFYDMDGAGWQATPLPATAKLPVQGPCGVTWSAQAHDLGIIVTDQVNNTVATFAGLSESPSVVSPSMLSGPLIDVCVSAGTVYVAASPYVLMPTI